MTKATRRTARLRRHQRIRRNLSGTAERPRLSVFRSLNHIYAQVIDDDKSMTITTASSLDTTIKGKANDKTKKELAALVGNLIASRTIEKGVETVVLDRGGYKYAGRVQSLAEQARKDGLNF